MHYIRHHPLVAVTLSYIAGIALSFSGNLPHQINYFLLFIAGITVVLTLLLQPKYAYLPLLLLFFLAGNLNGSLDQAYPDSPYHIYSQANEDTETVVLGTVQRVFGFNGRTSRFDVSASAKRTAATDFQPVQGIIRYTMEGHPPVTIIPGKTYAIRSKLRKPQKYGTPGAFDYPEYLAQQHIYLTGFISSPLYVQQVHTQQSLLGKFLYAPEVLRFRINNFLDNHLEAEIAAVYKALLTGDRSSVSSEVIDSFKGSGCLHILAISGIHMSLLAFVLYTCFFWLLRRSTWLINRVNTKKTAVLLCIPPLLFYTLIAGAKTPVLRSFIMSMVVIIAICYGKKHSLASLVSLAALIILAISPGDLATPSFQLTFAAVVSIGIAFPILRKTSAVMLASFSSPYIITPLTWLSASIIISAAATLGTAPLVIYHFNMVSLVGIAANLVIEPLVCLWSLILGFIATAFIFIYPGIAEVIFITGGKGISLAINAADFFNSLPYSSLVLASPSLFQVVVYYLSFLLLSYNNVLFKRYQMLAIAAFFMTTTSIVFPVKEMLKGYSKESLISYLDVGQGSCTLIETPGGKRILIDGGALSSPGFDIGKRLITPFLLSRKILVIDDVVITHPDSDHYNGIASILSQFKVKNLWVSTKENHDEGWQHLLDTAAVFDTRISVPGSGEVITKNDNMSLELLTNTTEMPALSSDNDSGIIVRYRHGHFSALFPGDISSRLEKKLVENERDLQATFLLAAHHGSATSNSMEFLSAVQPEVMVVSSGRKRKLFPSAAVTRRCSTLNIPVLTTNSAGTITVRVQEEKYSVKSYFFENQSKDWISATFTRQ